MDTIPLYLMPFFSVVYFSIGLSFYSKFRSLAIYSVTLEHWHKRSIVTLYCRKFGHQPSRIDTLFLCILLQHGIIDFIFPSGCVIVHSFLNDFHCLRVPVLYHDYGDVQG